MWWMDNIVLYYITVNKSSYIYSIILLFDKNSNDVEIFRHFVLKTKAKLVVFCFVYPTSK